MNRILLLLFILISSRSYAQFVRGIHTNVKTNGRVSSITIKDTYPRNNGAVDTAIFKQIFNTKGELVSEDESRVYDRRRTDTAALSKEMYRTWHTSYTYHYNSDGRLLKITWLRDHNPGTIHFNKQGYPIKEDYIGPDNYWIQIKKNYDVNGNLVRESTFYHDYFAFEAIYKYDQRNLEVETDQKGIDWHHVMYYFEYQSFNDKGNWTMVIRLTPDHKPGGISIRDIKYAD